MCDFFKNHVEVYIPANRPLKSKYLKVSKKRGNTCILKDYSAEHISFISAEKR